MRTTLTFKTLLAPSYLIGATVVLALAAVGIAFVYTAPKTGGGSYVAPTEGPITGLVDTTGTVKAAQTVDLSFQLSGTIASVDAPVGSHVAQGATLATLSTATLAASLEEAKAALQVQQAKLDSLKAGTRPEDIAVSQSEVAAAQESLTQDEATLLSAAEDAYVKSDDAIHNTVDQFFDAPRSSQPTLAITLSDSSVAASMQSQRVGIENLLNAWNADLNALPSAPTQTQVETIAKESQGNLAKISAYLNLVASGLTDAIPTSSQPLASIQGYQSAVGASRTSIAAAVSAIQAAQTAESAAVSGLATAQSKLALVQAPATAQDIEAQTAAVAQAQAAVDAARAQLGKAAIQAPFAGVVTRNDAHVGQTATPGVALLSLISDARFQIDTYVSQTALAKIATGQHASVTFDAYPGQSFLAHVITIDPAASIQNGTASYKVTLQLDTNDPRIRPGLTGNVAITVAQKADAMQVPKSAIITKEADTYVLKQTASSDALVPVTLGIRGTSTVEVLSGISASDRVRTFGAQ